MAQAQAQGPSPSSGADADASTAPALPETEVDVVQREASDVDVSGGETASLVAPAQVLRDPPPPAVRPRSSTLAGALSIVPFAAGASLALAGLVIANRDVEHFDDGRPPIDHFETGLGLTIAGGVLLAVGPSLGHAYAGKVWTRGLKTRVVGAAIGLAGLGLAALPIACSTSGFVCAHEGAGLLIVMGGGVTLAVGAAIDAATAPRAARTQASAPGVTLVPLRTRTASGLGLAGTF
jgi:hypothetical protein